MPAFLLEIGVEEIPAGMIAAAQADLAERVEKLLRRERIALDDLRVISYSTPRRLAAIAEGVLAKQVDAEEEVVGPSTKVAYKDGSPTPAAIAFAKKSGVEVSTLKTIQNAKGEYVAATVRRAGRFAADVLTTALSAEIGSIYWPKNMVWRASKPERFVRPVRWLVALLDEEILPVEFAGIVADRVTYGHRVLHGDAPVVIRKPQEYAARLEAAFVLADTSARRQRIRKSLDAAARTIPSARWREDEGLVETVTNLTEWPSVILGSFDPLRLPKEVLITVMRDHQKYFALEDANGKLLPNFLAVLNIEVDAGGSAIIRHGNERVLRARFNDARFFWDVDQKIPLIHRVEMLKHVTFHKDLGSYWDKTQANRAMARVLNDDLPTAMDASTVDTAILLAKADLTAEMVKEFTELQGVIGGLYAGAEGYPEEIAVAIGEHYLPEDATGPIPETRLGSIVALVDKMTTIVAMFAKGMIPTGSKDPFALRRAGSGVVRILVENAAVRQEIHLMTVVRVALDGAKWTGEGLGQQVLDFMLDRLEFYLQEKVGALLQVARAVRRSRASEDEVEVVGYGRVAEFAKALDAVVGSENVRTVAELFKRISNILRQAREKGIKYPGAEGAELSRESPGLLQEPAESELASKVTEANYMIQANYRDGKYDEVISSIASLREPLNAFFDNVMVMVDDEELRANRLALLARTEATVRWAADFSELASIQ